MYAILEMIIHGDSLHELSKLDTETVDLLCTDPPYGYSFMGKSWDKTLPDIGIFKECHRVLKAGAFAFVMSAPRSDVCARMMLMLEDAGFNIGFTPIYWTYASGFPKAMNIGKMVDKRLGAKREKGKVKIYPNGTSRNDTNAEKWNNVVNYSPQKPASERYETLPATDAAKALDGSYGGFQPKPAVEVVIVAMKPLSEKTFVDQALKNGKGITWLDDCRVGTETITTHNQVGVDKFQTKYGGNLIPKTGDTTHQGRFPANLLVSDDVLNDGRVIKGAGHFPKSIKNASQFRSNQEQEEQHLGDSGSYSRYFSLDAWAKTLPFLIVPKASKREKDAGLYHLPIRRPDARTSTGMGSFEEKGVLPGRNHHPTVKPLTLMSYLITLGSRPGDTVLDPFLGSGTTAIAAKQLGRKYIGIEREGEYVEIAEARLRAAQDALL